MASPTIRSLPAGGHHDLAQYWNVSGHVSVAIATESGSNQLPAVWWINGVGKVTQLGPQQNHFVTQIAWNKLFFRAKLRCATSERTKVFIWDKISPGHIIPPGVVKFDWP